jgi:hypothetical protein
MAHKTQGRHRKVDIDLTRLELTPRPRGTSPRPVDIDLTARPGGGTDPRRAGSADSRRLLDTTLLMASAQAASLHYSQPVPAARASAVTGRIVVSLALGIWVLDALLLGQIVRL